MLPRKIISTLTVVAVATGLTLLASSPAMASGDLECASVGYNPSHTIVYVDCTLTDTSPSMEVWSGLPAIPLSNGEATAQGNCPASNRNPFTITVNYYNAGVKAPQLSSEVYCSL